MAKLIANTIVQNPQTGTPVLLAAGGDVPDWAEGLVGDHLLDTADQPRSSATSAPAPSAEQDTSPAVPPRSGPGSGAPQWRAYARSVGVEVADDTSRDDVIEALDAAGKPTK